MKNLTAYRFRAAAAVVTGMLLTSMFGAASRPAVADPPAEAARLVVGKNKSAVVTLSIVVKFSGGDFGGDSNSDLEATGFVVDPTGLIVTTNMAIDPASSMAALGGGDTGGAKFTTKVVSLKIISANGDEMPGKVVLRDTDKNLAFIRPVTPVTSPMPFIDLKTAAKAQIGDPIFVLGRLSKSANRGPDLKMERVIGVVERPRTLYVLDSDLMQSIGTAIFNEAGAPLGILTMRISPGRRRSFSAQDSFMAVVVPADDVLEVGAQAPQAKDVRDVDTASPAPSPTKQPAAKPGAVPPGKKPKP